MEVLSIKKLSFNIILFSLMSSALAQTHLESRTQNFFASIKNDAKKLLNFVQDMPKGADIHNHIDGAALAENMLRYAFNDNLCVDRENYTVSPNKKCSADNSLNKAVETDLFKENLIDAWSMRHFNAKTSSAHDHFFATFVKFKTITKFHGSEIMTEIVERAASQNEIYLELMLTPDGSAASKLGKKVGWDPNLAKMRAKLLSAEFDDILHNISLKLDNDEQTMRQQLACNTNKASQGCDIEIRYLYQVHREQPPEMVFAQLLTGFESAIKDPRLVGVNMVQPEDGIISMRDYRLHMQMVGYLHRLYPSVKISLHAGELNNLLVPDDGLKFHIREAVQIARANRIGHGVDIAQENNADELLRQMANEHILVEINLSSNAFILGVEGKDHPLPLYLQYDVPIALSTDDEGINRENLSQQYLRATTAYNLSYPTLKTFARNSISYAFVPGKNLWVDRRYQQIELACQQDELGSANPSTSCKEFLAANEKANLQWRLEQKFVEFESRY